MDGFTKTKLAPLLLAILLCQGCAHGIMTARSDITENAIPAHRLPAAFAGKSKDNLVPVDFTWLRRPPMDEHIIGPMDILGIYIQDVLDAESLLPTVHFPVRDTSDLIEAPSVGHPVDVQPDGTASLPLVGNISLQGKTLSQAADTIRSAYLAESILRPGRERVMVDLIKPRSVEVFVVREDTDPNTPALTRRDTQVFAKRGTSTLLELPIYHNDVLTALSETGGLPGVDGFNEVWILRSSKTRKQAQILGAFESGSRPEDIVEYYDSEFVRIPLRVCPGQPAPFTMEDVILQDGDVVFIEARDIEYFLVGGLIAGAKIPIPRDHDVDVIEAIAIANSNVNGPAGNATATNFRSGPGNIVAPTDAVVVRQLSNGEQIKILVDLKVAMNDPRERIRILPRDLIILRYKPRELLANIALNFINVNYSIPNN